MNGETTQHPIEFSALRKGQVLSEAEIVTALGVRPAEGTKWAFAVMGLQRDIEVHAGLIARVDGNTIRVLTDLEADQWTSRNISLGVRRLVKNAERRQMIDRSSFTANEASAAQVRDRIAVATAQAALRAHREAKALERARETTKEISASARHG